MISKSRTPKRIVADPSIYRSYDASLQSPGGCFIVNSLPVEDMHSRMLDSRRAWLGTGSSQCLAPPIW